MSTCQDALTVMHKMINDDDNGDDDDNDDDGGNDKQYWK